MIERGTNEPEQKSSKVHDPEIQALAKLDRILATMGPAAAIRALNWLDSRYGVGSRFRTLVNTPANGEVE